MRTKNLPDTPAVRAMTDVLGSGLAPESLDQIYDLLKLMGIVLGHSTLLQIATDPEAENKDRVAAAKVLALVKDNPEEIADRLKRSQFSALSVDELRAIVRRIESGERDLTSLLKESTDGNSKN